MPLLTALRHPVRAAAWLVLAAPFAASAPLAAQTTDDDNLYRAELVLMERLESRDGIVEKMVDRSPAPLPEEAEALWIPQDDAPALSDRDLLPAEEMHLREAAARLERSGRYRVLMTAAWHQRYAPGFDSGPMIVQLGDKLPLLGDRRQFEGSIRIERRRYLHVHARIHHWRTTIPTLPEFTSLTDSPIAAGLSPHDGAEQGEMAPAPLALPKRELVTWLHETRRMRSEKLHYLDSPTLGLLVYFEPIDADDMETGTLETAGDQ
ncbi:peptidoglycan-binding protein CsiV [Tamilnaduibacter salinus]|uniref:Peptidoglycan-binding protein CsiV n=1 Tax=Tamilnaduibacter salinus TaxID=1484056 RepID=A0A2U1CVL1_9GAMM|nr:CsiV family protein [Tamilnaduibacter salinus]PVY75454.1 peptidoglycan-binding protein CsiV [Tamilnaduibacter salinus]